VRGITDRPKGALSESGFGLAVLSEGFGGIGTSLAGGTTTCPRMTTGIAKKKAPTT
jgi:hypothetical protein